MVWLTSKQPLQWYNICEWGEIHSILNMGHIIILFIIIFNYGLYACNCRKNSNWARNHTWMRLLRIIWKEDIPLGDTICIRSICNMNLWRRQLRTYLKTWEKMTGIGSSIGGTMRNFWSVNYSIPKLSFYLLGVGFRIGLLFHFYTCQFCNLYAET